MKFGTWKLGPQQTSDVFWAERYKRGPQYDIKHATLYIYILIYYAYIKFIKRHELHPLPYIFPFEVSR